ncbi:MAG: protein kinase [Anaerolineae bacterium]|nr:protein kinase [Anaerolineae bacterium]
MLPLDNIQAQIPARYQIIEAIGTGGMGTVYRVRDRLRGEEIALKHIANNRLPFNNLDSSQGRRHRTALTNEFRTLTSLRHPNIITVIDYGFDQEKIPFFTMEWLRNAVTLNMACENRPQEVVVGLLAQLLRALFYIHRRGITHRDLKPSNILVMPDTGQLRVLDFGLSIQTGAADHTSGTLPYLAPELLSGSHATPAADLHAVGVLVYEILTGQHPFLSERVVDTITRILEQQPSTAQARIPPGLRPWLDRLLAKNPAERYPDAREALIALNEAAGTDYPPETIATRESFIRAAAFAGREAELKTLRMDLHRVQNTREGRLWLISGESGVGKSRLIDELRVDALIEGVTVLGGQALPEGNTPYHLWVPLLPALVLTATFSENQLSLLNAFQFSVDLASLLDRPIPAPPDTQGSALRDQLVELVVELALQYPDPLLIVLEDIHWADNDSMVTLERLSRRVGERPILLVVTYRSEEAPRFHERLPGAQRLALRRLERPAVAQIIRSIVGDSEQPEHFIDQVMAETGGNAFFFTELVRSMAEETGDLQSVPQVRNITTPQRIRNLLAKRIDALSPQTKVLMDAAAVAGAEIQMSVLQQLLPGMNVEAMLQEAAEYHVTEWRDGQWRFTHDQLRNYLIDRLPHNRKRFLHYDIAQAMEKLYQDDTLGRLHLPLIAFHWEAAGQCQRALPHLVTIAQDAFRVAALENALEYLDRALNCVPDAQNLPDRTARQLMDVHYLRFYVRRQTEERDQLLPEFEKALALAQQSGLRDLLMRAYQLGADAGALTYNARLARTYALEMLKHSPPNSGEFLLAMYRLSQGYRAERRFAEAIQVAEHALQRLRPNLPWRGWNFETTLVTFHALTSFFSSLREAQWAFETSLGYCQAMQGNVDATETHFGRALAAVQTEAAGARLLIAQHNYALVLQGNGKTEKALPIAQELFNLAPRLFPALRNTAAHLLAITEARSAHQLTRAAEQLEKLAALNLSEQEIEDGILCARDARRLYLELGDESGALRAVQLLRELNDPLLA